MAVEAVVEEDKKEFEKRVMNAIEETRAEVEEASDASNRAENLRISTYWNTGTRLYDLSEGKSDQESKSILARFHKELNISASMLVISKQFRERFTKADYDLAIKHKLTVRAMKALVAIEDDRKRKEFFKRVINEGLTAECIRAIKGTIGVRRAANKAAARARPKVESPVKVFTRLDQRVDGISSSLGETIETIGRLDELTDERREEAVSVLVAARAKLTLLAQEITMALKFTKNYAPKKKTAARGATVSK